jgi:putative FmdB family regulatory protein
MIKFYRDVFRSFGAMPIYEYQCQKCGEISEVFLTSGEKQPVRCSVCKGKLQKIISQSGFQFKGTGWYVTDYARKGKKDSSTHEEKSPPASTPAASAAPASESAPKEKDSKK